MGRNRKGCVAGTSIHKEKQKQSSPIKFLGAMGTLMARKDGGNEAAQTYAKENTLMGKLFNRGNTPSVTPTGPTSAPTDPVTSPMNKGQAIEYASYMTRGKGKI